MPFLYYWDINIQLYNNVFWVKISFHYETSVKFIFRRKKPNGKASAGWKLKGKWIRPAFFYCSRGRALLCKVRLSGVGGWRLCAARQSIPGDWLRLLVLFADLLIFPFFVLDLCWWWANFANTSNRFIDFNSRIEHKTLQPTPSISISK